MISRRHDKIAPGPFRDLAEYIAGAREEGEKLDDLWIVNAKAGTSPGDLNVAICEIDATQALNTTVKRNKSYHLVVSFPKSEQPSPEALRDIERGFAVALGFADHPRVVGTHANTDHFHMHIGYSRIHPVTLKAHWPEHDFPKRDKVCRTMEAKYGLTVDRGKTEKITFQRIPQSAQDMEAHTWEQSFYSYVRSHKDKILKGVDKAKLWSDVHEAFAVDDLVLKKRGNGLVITSGNGKHYIKASSIDRSLSKPALEKRFGPFEPARQVLKNPKRTYKRQPITAHPQQGKLWRFSLEQRNTKDSISIKIFKSWRDYLTLGAIHDPLAIAIIQAHRQILSAMSLQSLNSRPSVKPKHVGNRHGGPELGR